MRRELMETLREGPDAARVQESGGRRANRPMGGTPHRRRRYWAALPGWCLATIALYALVVLVVRPEGTPSGFARLIALLVIAAAALVTVAAARWAPAWLRGAALLLVGFAMVAVLGGVVVDRIVQGVSVGAAVGMAAGIAGIALVVVGWQRLLHPIPRRWLRMLAAIVSTLVVAQFVLLPSTWALAVTNRGHPLGSGRTPATVGLPYQDVRISSFDGTRLAGWWVPARNGAAVMVLTGSGSTRDDVLAHAALVARAGYGALLLDFRGHGDSGGRIMDMGWGAERDVHAAVSWVLARPGVRRVGVLGLSMGGEVALTAAAQDPRIAAVVAEGATARTWADTRRDPAANPVATANEWLQFRLIELLAPEPQPVPLIDAVRSIDVPVLLIAGNGPREADLDARYAKAAPDTVTLWSIADTPHTRGLWTHPTDYRQRVLGVFDAALG